MRATHRIVHALVALSVAGATVASLALPAWACPSCATRESAGTSVFVLVGAMIAVPYVIAAVALPAIRRLATDSDRPEPREVRP